MDLPDYTPAEERLNYQTHAVGFVFAAIGIFFMARHYWYQPDTKLLLGTTVYSITAAFALFSSAVYHGLKNMEAKKTFRFIDHAAIYILIAGSYTPFALGNLRDVCGSSMLTMAWILAVAGIIFKFAIRNHLDRLERIDSLLYLVFGFMALFYIQYIVGYLPPTAVQLLALGGALYVVGVYFYLSKTIRFNHAIWHLFVMAAVACHYAAVYGYTAPPQ